MAKIKKKREPHLLDPLFQTAIRGMSFKRFNEKAAQILPIMPYPWAWPDPKTDQTWTLMGRKAHLLWNASPAHCVKNHTLATHSIELAIKQGQVWHESEKGKPDILMMWLASCRYGSSHGRTQDLLARALILDPPGLGVKGDGGYLDKMISLVEEEAYKGTNPNRLDLIHSHVVSYWWRGTLLGTMGTMQADWRPISSIPLTTCWPTETLERVLRLSNHTRGGQTSQISKAGAQSLIRQLKGQTEKDELTHRTPQSFLDAVVEDAMGKGVGETLPFGALLVVEHCLTEGLCPDPKLLNALSHYEDRRLEDMPLLKTAVQHHGLQTTTDLSGSSDSIKRPRL